MILTTTSDVNVNIQGHYDRNLIDRALPLLLHDRFAQVRPIPKNSGTMITFRAYGSLPVASQLTEGVTPEGKKATTSDISTTLVQFGDYIGYSDWLSMTSLDPTLVEFSELLGEQAGDTLDQYHRDNLVSGTNVRYAGGVSARASINAAPSKDDLESIVRTLEGNNCKKLRDMIAPTTKVSTSPIRAAYIAIAHTDARQDLEAVPGFVPVEQYPSQSGVLEGEMGSFKGIRFLGTTNAKIHTASGSATLNDMVSSDDTNVDVYVTMVFGKNYYGTVPLQKKSISNIVKKLGSGGTNDALNQRGTSGWKAFTGGKILDDDNGVRFEHAVSDLS
jgi:N4-gp56 family major capsid protein